MIEVDVRVRESGQLFTRKGIKIMGCCDLIKSQALDPPVLISQLHSHFNTQPCILLGFFSALMGHNSKVAHHWTSCESQVMIGLWSISDQGIDLCQAWKGLCQHCGPCRWRLMKEVTNKTWEKMRETLTWSFQMWPLGGCEMIFSPNKEYVTMCPRTTFARCFHFRWEVGKLGCCVAAAMMMAWLWTDVCHTHNTLSLCIGGNAHCALCTVLPWKALAKYVTPSGHERRQHFGDYRSKKELKERGVGLSQWKKEERGEAGAGMA